MHETLLMDFLVDPNRIPHHVSYAVLATIALWVMALMLRASMRLVPGGLQNFVEVILDAMYDLAEESIGHGWGERFFGLIATLFLYILICNYMGLIPGFASPTANINMTASMAIPVFLVTHIVGLYVHRHHYVKHFMGPVALLAPLMIIVEGLSHLARPVTLSVRLFGNMVAKHFLIMVLLMLMPAVLPTLVLCLGLLVGLVQAYVFALLTTLYMAGAVEEAH